MKPFGACEPKIQGLIKKRPVEMNILLRGCWLQQKPGRFRVDGAVAFQWRLVERSDTKIDRVDLAFDVGAVVDHQKRSFAKLHYVQRGRSDRC